MQSLMLAEAACANRPLGQDVQDPSAGYVSAGHANCGTAGSGRNSACRTTTRSTSTSVAITLAVCRLDRPNRVRANLLEARVSACACACRLGYVETKLAGSSLIDVHCQQ
eukprot:COSAG04_NODE_2830_length_3521_cov_1.507306_2_plen_110_part_00